MMASGKDLLRLKPLGLCWLGLAVLIADVKSELNNVTSQVFPSSPQLGLVAAFGDFNADKATDIFVLSNDGRSLFLLEADIDITKEGTKFKNKTIFFGRAEDAVITNVVPGDFNNDLQMDLLVTRKQSDTSTQVKVEIYTAISSGGTRNITVNGTFRDQPIVIDANGDMIPDLFGETEDGRRAFWIFHDNDSYTVKYLEEVNKTLAPLRVPQSSAFLDLNGDLSADLCAVSEINGVVLFEFWLNIGGNLTHVRNITAPQELKVKGQPSFMDMSGNHEINIILPGCLDEACLNASIFVWCDTKGVPGGTWHQLDVNFKADKDNFWTFPREIKPSSWLSLPMALRIGDFNLDGYPDAVSIFADSKNNLSAFLLNNVECGSRCQNFSRTFSIDTSQPLHKSKPSLITFFDFMENGVLDILLTENLNGDSVMRATQQDFTGDASFLKVMTVNGKCHKSCPDGHSPYGVNQVGPTTSFDSTTPTGGIQTSIASQLTQSSYFALQLPFILFGLGQTPNFVDQLQVGIPFPAGQVPRNRSWSSIIPNSQIIVIPYPLGDPDSWMHELYVTPSRLVLLTGASLLGTCAFIGIIGLLLHWKERVEDKKEKLQEAQLFHFDAM